MNSPRQLPWTARALSTLLRKLPPGMRGKQRLARLLLRPWLDSTDVEIRDREGHRLHVPKLAESVAFELLIHGVYEPLTLAFIRKSLTRGSAFVDVGANIGAFVLPASRYVGADGKVLAVEASSRVFQCLQANVERNDAAGIVTAIHCAACDRDGEAVSF